jgi:hypothetical protein
MAPTKLPDPEAFAGLMRAAQEDAVSASVHHASLSQQYLSLAQKFTGLAEQSAFGPGGMFEYAQRLDREAATGIPANAELRQISKLSTAESSTAEPSTAEPPTAASPADAMPADAPPADSRPAPPVPVRSPQLLSPPARTSLKTLTECAREAQQQVCEDRATTEKAPDALQDKEISGSVGAPSQGTAVCGSTAKQKPRGIRRSRISIRRLLDRVRLAAVEQADRVRLRVREKDLKPKLRKTSEEMVQELKRSRRPATMSAAVTLIVLGILAAGRLELTEEEPLPPLSGSFSGPTEEAEEAVLIDQILEQAGEQQEKPAEQEAALAESQPLPEPTPEPLPEPPRLPPELELTEPELQLANLELPETPLPESPVGTQPVKQPSTKTAPTSKTQSWQHRSDAGRKEMLAKYGGSAGSESAVGLALEWLAKRQRADGSWDFADVGPCTQPGRISNPIGGTAYALLPFLAAGQTHRQGNYRKQVQAGLQYLTNVGVTVPAGYDLRRSDQSTGRRSGTQLRLLCTRGGHTGSV